MKKIDAMKVHAAAEGKLAPPPQGRQRPVKELLYELREHQIELEIQNEQLRQSQFELETSRDRYVDFYDLSPVAYLTLNHDGMITEAGYPDKCGDASMHGWRTQFCKIDRRWARIIPKTTPNF